MWPTSFDRSRDVSLAIPKSICIARPALPRLRSFNHRADALGIERLTSLVAVAGTLQPGTDFAVAQASGFSPRPPKAFRLRNHRRPQLRM